MRDARVKSSAEYEAARGLLVRAAHAASAGALGEAGDLAIQAGFNAGAAYVHALEAEEPAFQRSILRLQDDIKKVVEHISSRGVRAANPSSPMLGSVEDAIEQGMISAQQESVVGWSGMTRHTHSNPSWPVTLGTAATALGAGYLLGGFGAIPDFDRMLDQVEVEIQANNTNKAAKLLRKAFESLEKLYQQMGGSALEIRSRMETLNAKLPAKKQVFGLKQGGRSRNPALNIKALKRSLLK